MVAANPWSAERMDLEAWGAENLYKAPWLSHWRNLVAQEEEG